MALSLTEGTIGTTDGSLNDIFLSLDNRIETLETTVSNKKVVKLATCEYGDGSTQTFTIDNINNFDFIRLVCYQANSSKTKIRAFSSIDSSLDFFKTTDSTYSLDSSKVVSSGTGTVSYGVTCYIVDDTTVAIAVNSSGFFAVLYGIKY